MSYEIMLVGNCKLPPESFDALEKSIDREWLERLEVSDEALAIATIAVGHGITEMHPLLNGHLLCVIKGGSLIISSTTRMFKQHFYSNGAFFKRTNGRMVESEHYRPIMPGDTQSTYPPKSHTVKSSINPTYHSQPIDNEKASYRDGNILDLVDEEDTVQKYDDVLYNLVNAIMISSVYDGGKHECFVGLESEVERCLYDLYRNIDYSNFQTIEQCPTFNREIFRFDVLNNDAVIKSVCAISVNGGAFIMCTKNAWV